MEDQKHSYLTEEAKDVRSQYLSNVNTIHDLEKYTLLATVSIWSWGISYFSAQSAVSDESNYAFLTLMLLPLLPQSVFGIRAYGIYQDMKAMMTYLKNIENELELNSMGWANFWDKQKVNSLRITTNFIIWPLCNITTFGIAFFLF